MSDKFKPLDSPEFCPPQEPIYIEEQDLFESERPNRHKWENQNIFRMNFIGGEVHFVTQFYSDVSDTIRKKVEIIFRDRIHRYIRDELMDLFIENEIENKKD